MQPVTMEFTDADLEKRFRQEQFTKTSVLIMAGWCVTIPLVTTTTVFFVTQTLPFVSIMNGSVLLNGSFLRAHFHKMRPTPWRLRGWTLSCFLLTTQCFVVNYFWGPHANQLTSIHETSPPAYGLMCVGHAVFFMVSIFVVFLEAGFDFWHKCALSAMFWLITHTSGNPSPHLDDNVRTSTALIGSCIGFALARAFEARTRDAFVEATVARDTMLVWRAVAVQAGAMAM